MTHRAVAATSGHLVDQISHTVLRFEGFALDLTRGCLHDGAREIELRPKAFEVLTYLALNAGRLVPKKELLEAVWAGVVVSDESLVQCIRELRQKMGDSAHLLIKTVPRRGYVLETTITTQPVVPAARSIADGRTNALLRRQRGVAGLAALRKFLSRYWPAKQHIWLHASVLTTLVLAAVLPASLWTYQQPPGSSRLFTEADEMGVAAIAADKQLPMPSFRILEPARNAPKEARRFIGIWVTDRGWPNSNRQLMLIVTYVDGHGQAVGYAVDGPPQPLSHVQGPAGFNPFRARISGASLSYGSEQNLRMISFSPDNHAVFHKRWPDGFEASVSLEPIWTLVEAERASTLGAATR